ncbi:MAG: protein phosphatase 2C domain-containing protein [Lachnospiraceae bacterium]|nr:protein phosphatase 2C domain-containing protein [Lachnospiraceae bacterium]
MIKFTAYTDIGRKNVNQDAFTVRTAMAGNDEIVMAVLCDGMGGECDGDKASEDTILAFETWFNNTLPELLKIGNVKTENFSYKNVTLGRMTEEIVTVEILGGEEFEEELEVEENALSRDETIIESLRENVEIQNTKLINYGKKTTRRLGTTLSSILILRDKIILAHVGDSRIYKLDCNQIQQLTTDHSFVAREVKNGNITEEEAKHHPKRNVLTQCIGVSGNANPQLTILERLPNTVYLLCSDGFVHENEEEIMWQLLNPNNGLSEDEIQNRIVELINNAKNSGEKDNITAVVVSDT